MKVYLHFTLFIGRKKDLNVKETAGVVKLNLGDGRRKEDGIQLSFLGSLHK